MQLNCRQRMILVALAGARLDRIRLMKTLFLTWHREGRPANWPFEFKPYLYGPCALDVYSSLEELERRGLIIQAQHANARWGRYYLTQAGQEVLTIAPPQGKCETRILEIARWADSRDFASLLRSVYAEAPDFAVRSIFRDPLPA